MTEEIRLSIFDLCVARNAGLLALMSVLSQSFFTLVRRHLMSFFLFSAWHSCKCLNMVCEMCELPELFDVGHKGFSRLEGGNVVLGDDDGGVFGDVASSLFGAFFEDEATETSQINVFTVGERLFDRCHKRFYDRERSGFVDTGLLGNGVNDVCFSHLS